MRRPNVRAARKARIQAFIERRNSILRRLDEVEFMVFMREIGAWETPVNPTVPLAAMHKCRLHVNEFTEAEKQQSRDWLKANGYKERL